ncbi:7649_t:CDS:2, partial [Diversispora eburnea]
MFVDTIVEGKFPVKALIDTTSKYNTISKHLFDKLEENYGICHICDPVKILYVNVIAFQIHKNPSFDLVLGQEWLWMHKAKISFEFSPKAHSHHAKIVINGMSILLIDKDFNINSFTKNNSSNSAKSKAGLAQEEVMNIINKIISNIEDHKWRKRYHGNKLLIPPTPRRLDNNALKNSETTKNKKYPKVDLGDGGKLPWIKSKTETSSSSSDLEFT